MRLLSIHRIILHFCFNLLCCNFSWFPCKTYVKSLHKYSVLCVLLSSRFILETNEGISSDIDEE
jgi:hypothetical protein